MKRIHHMTCLSPVLVSKQENGSWKLITSGSGMAGFCFPVQRWNGKVYMPNRFEYEGKACKPN
jgi:hypothetical protein